MTRYVRLSWSFFQYAVKRELEFRFNLAMFLLFDLLWFALSLFGVILIFRQAGTVAGWREQEAVLLVLVYYVSSTVLKVLVIPGAERLSELVRRGDFDFFLVRPIDPQFLVSIERLYVHEIVRSVLVALILPWYVASIGISMTLFQWFLVVVAVVLGAIGLYGVYFIIATLSFWVENLFNIGDLFREMLDVAKRPSDIFTGLASHVATFVIPVGLVATIPTKILLGNVDWNTMLWVAVSSIALFWIARIFFLVSLRRYGSASS